MSASTRYQPQAYKTRLDELRLRLGIDLVQWWEGASINEHQLLKYRKGRDMLADDLASLVRSARKLTRNMKLRAHQLVDVGEDEPIPATRDQRLRARYSALDLRRTFPTALDGLLIREGVWPTLLEAESGITRVTIFRIREGNHAPRASTIRKLVAALTRLLGRRVYAQEVYDVGDGNVSAEE
jgi:predicted transcriptional regulator